MMMPLRMQQQLTTASPDVLYILPHMVMFFIADPPYPYSRNHVTSNEHKQNQIVQTMTKKNDQQNETSVLRTAETILVPNSYLPRGN